MPKETPVSNQMGVGGEEFFGRGSSEVFPRE
jgi:hypothetical protein